MSVLRYRDSATGQWTELRLVGPAGAQGLKGPVGDKGATGATGDKGPIGDTGTKGATGIQGPQGNTGGQGPQGAPGSPAGITFRRGEAYIVPVANTSTAVTIGYDGFTQLPTIFCCNRGSVPGTVKCCGTGTGPGLTSTTVNVVRTNTTGTYVQWIAVGVGSPS